MDIAQSYPNDSKEYSYNCVWPEARAKPITGRAATGSLGIEVPGGAFLLAMKVLAARRREAVDIKFLVKHLNPEDAD
jgi:hypothetical protein